MLCMNGNWIHSVILYLIMWRRHYAAPQNYTTCCRITWRSPTWKCCAIKQVCTFVVLLLVSFGIFEWIFFSLVRFECWSMQCRWCEPVWLFCFSRIVAWMQYAYFTSVTVLHFCVCVAAFASIVTYLFTYLSSDYPQFVHQCTRFPSAFIMHY